MKQIEDKSLLYELTYYRLMENAGSAAAAFIRRTFDVEGLSCIIFCGRGNNGGDGLVVARKLAESGARVLIVFVDGMPRSKEAQAMYSMVELMELPVCKDFDAAYDQLMSLVAQADIVVDAVYGTGFRGQLDQRQALVCSLINSAIAAIISLDVPSGVECDTGRAASGAVKADFTVVFDSYKPLHIQQAAADFCGLVELVDIGVPPEAKEGVGREFLTVDTTQVLALLPPRLADSHKGTFGWLLNIAGSACYRGAAALSTMAALRAGAGRVTLASTELVCQNAAGHILESIFLPLPSTSQGTISRDAVTTLCDAMPTATAVLVGCGLGDTADSAALLSSVLQNAVCPVVVDADGLNALAGNIHLLSEKKAPVVLTPHPGEMARLLGVSTEEVQGNRHGAALHLAENHGVIVVLKGHETVVASPDGTVVLGSTGNAGLAKAGSGDLLAGMIGGLLAQGMEPRDAAVCAVHLHGLAADLTAQRLSQRTMLPSDILEDIHLDRTEDEELPAMPESPPPPDAPPPPDVPPIPAAPVPPVQPPQEPAPAAPPPEPAPPPAAPGPAPASPAAPPPEETPPIEFHWME